MIRLRRVWGVYEADGLVTRSVWAHITPTWKTTETQNKRTAGMGDRGKSPVHGGSGGS